MLDSRQIRDTVVYVRSALPYLVQRFGILLAHQFGVLSIALYCKDPYSVQRIGTKLRFEVHVLVRLFVRFVSTDNAGGKMLISAKIIITILFAPRVNLINLINLIYFINLINLIYLNS